MFLARTRERKLSTSYNHLTKTITPSFRTDLQNHITLHTVTQNRAWSTPLTQISIYRTPFSHWPQYTKETAQVQLQITPCPFLFFLVLPCSSLFVLVLLCSSLSFLCSSLFVFLARLKNENRRASDFTKI